MVPITYIPTNSKERLASVILDATAKEILGVGVVGVGVVNGSNRDPDP